MKKILKKEVIIAFIIGVLISSGLTVYAATYLASQVIYKNGQSVEEALDDLYKKQIRFDIDDNVIHGGDAVAVSSISGFEIGKYYIIYLRHNSNDLPDLTDVEFIMPMRKFEYINTTKLEYTNVYIAIIKAKSTTITLSKNSVISAKKLAY